MNPLLAFHGLTKFIPRVHITVAGKPWAPWLITLAQSRIWFYWSKQYKLATPCGKRLPSSSGSTPSTVAHRNQKLRLILIYLDQQTKCSFKMWPAQKKMIDNLLAGVFCHVFFATLLGEIPRPSSVPPCCPGSSPALENLLARIPADILTGFGHLWQPNWVAGEVCQSYQS